MDLKSLTARVISLFLIASGLYQMLYSLESIFLIYPQFSSRFGEQSLIIQEGLIEKALIIYATMIVDGIYGTTLLFKPARKIKTAHIVIGFLIAVASVFFITKTPLTTDPVQQFLLNLLKG